MKNIRPINKSLLSFALVLVILAQFCGIASGAPVAVALERPSGAHLEILFRDFESRVGKVLHEFQIPGMAVAVVQGAEVIYAKGFGVKKLEGDDPVTTATIFQIGSTSKAFTSALVASVVEEGKADWKDRVVMHLPYFAMEDPWVTREFQVRDLMAQHSGMKPYAGDFLAMIGFDGTTLSAPLPISGLYTASGPSSPTSTTCGLPPRQWWRPEQAVPGSRTSRKGSSTPWGCRRPPVRCRGFSGRLTGQASTFWKRG